MITAGFKVLVVGGGPVGLTAACALDRAGIDFLLLERRSEVVEKVGAGVVLSPMGIPALRSLGLAKELDQYGSELGTINRLDHDGNDLGANELFHRIKEAVGMGPTVITRHHLTKMLYNRLSARARAQILVNKTLSELTTHPNGVTATCTDGTTHSATIVIGADGAHSRVRRIMRDMAIASGSSNINPENPFISTYRCLWVRFPRPASLPEGYVCESHGPSAATQLFIGAHDGLTGVYERLPSKTSERTHYTPADADALAARWAHVPVTSTAPRFTLGELYAQRLDAGLVSLEEGAVPHWSHAGRVVLVGDAAHKYTPSTGAGCNAGIVDVAVLVRELRDTLRGAATTTSSSESTPATPAPLPSASQLNVAFTRYQSQRAKQVETECAISGRATATATWETPFQRLLDQYVMSLGLVQRVLDALILRGSRAGGVPTFDYDPVPMEAPAQRAVTV